MKATLVGGYLFYWDSTLVQMCLHGRDTSHSLLAWSGRSWTEEIYQPSKVLFVEKSTGNKLPKTYDFAFLEFSMWCGNLRENCHVTGGVEHLLKEDMEILKVRIFFFMMKLSQLQKVLVIDASTDRGRSWSRSDSIGWSAHMEGSVLTCRWDLLAKSEERERKASDGIIGWVGEESRRWMFDGFNYLSELGGRPICMGSLPWK